jgi:hypothetical protein
MPIPGVRSASKLTKNPGVPEDELSESLSEYATRAGLCSGVSGRRGQVGLPETLGIMQMWEAENESEKMLLIFGRKGKSMLEVEM